ncbi:hypothetical protein ACVWW6_006032 [Bradyrhizobium sp. USDA 3311]
MTYQTSQLSLWTQTIEGNFKEWLYISADPLATILGTGYFSDAGQKRLNVGDLVWVMSGTLNAATVTEGAEVFPATPGVGGAFSSAPTWQPCLVASVSAAGAGTLVAAALPASSGVANFRNLLDGGDFTVNPWQRGTSQAADITNTVTYMADRFFTVGGASSAINWSKQADTGVAGFAQALRWQRKSANADTAKIQMGQVLETADSIRAQGQQVTLSFYVKCGANFLGSSANFTAAIVSGTGTDQSAANLAAGTWTGQATVASQVVAPTTNDQLVILTGTVPVGATQLGVLLNYTPSGNAGANEWLQFKGFQLEIGGQATVFEHRDAQVELEICQRYCWVTNEPAAGVVVGAGMNTTAAIQVFYMATPVQMRIAPTVTVTAGTFKTNQASVATATTITAGTTHTPNAISINGNSAGTQGQATLLQGGGGAGSIVANADY